MQYLRQSTSATVVIGPVWATADGVLKADLAYDAAGINCDIYKNGTKADITLANSAGDGYFRAASGEALYLLTLSTGHTDTLGRLEISLSATGYYMKPRSYMVVPANVWDSLFGADYLQVDAVQVEGSDATNQIRDAVVDDATRIDASALNTLSGHDPGEAIMGATDLGTGAGLTSLASAANLATVAGYVDTEVAAILAAVDTEVAAIKAKTDNLPASPAAVGSAMTLTSAYDAAKSAAAAGAKMDLVDAPNATAVTAIQSGLATATALDAVDDFVDTEVGAIKAVTDKLDTALELDSTVYRFTTNALEQAPTGGSAPTAAAIADAVLDEAMSGHTTAGTLGKAVADTLADTNELQTDWHDGGRLDLILDAASAPSAADVADAVWDEAIADHDGVGSTGEQLAAAGAAGDPWATALPGSYGAGTAGLLLGTTIPAAIDAVDNYVDTEIGALATTIGAAGAGLTAVPWNAAWDAEVQSECTDALNAYDPPTKTEMDSAIAGGDDAVLARLGTPAGASVSADLADIEGKVDDLEGRLTATRAGYLDNLATAPPTAAQIKTAIEAAGGSIAAILEDTGTTLDTLVKDIPTNSELTTALASADDAVLAAITAAHSTTDGKLDTIDNFLDTEIAAILADTTLLESLGAAVADILADTSELQADWHDGGRLDLILDAVGGTDVTDILDWILNKMVRTDNGDGTITYVLYADDNTTPKWTWVYTTETGVRAKAT